MFSFFWRVMQKLWYNHEKKRRRQEIEMATWNSRGLRGSTLEEFINRTNEKYLENGLALIQKVPTPITPINIDKATRHITLAYFDQKSTVDYIGAVQGIPVCFDAKECNTDTFPLQNIHEHQVVFMENFEKQRGIAFFLISFTARDELSAVCKTAGILEPGKRGWQKKLPLWRTGAWFFSPEEQRRPCSISGCDAKRFGNEGLTSRYSFHIINQAVSFATTLAY